MSVAVLVSHYNRPQALARSLPQIAALGAPVLVVDDGSEFDNWQAAQAICESAEADLLSLPQNRGLAAVLNIGLEYFLADKDVEWISYFQDDVDVKPETLRSVMAVADRVHRPIVTGHDAAEHGAFGAPMTLNGVRFVQKKTCRATHMHAHRDYWRRVMPIPTRKLGAPCREPGQPRGTGSDVDWWVTQRAPQSILRAGGFVACVPGLVRTFLWKAEDSCWDNGVPSPEPELG